MALLRRDLRWPPLAFVATGLLFVGPGGILAQNSTVVCGSSFNWMDNSLGQNPCIVSAYLQSVCNNGKFTVNPLPNNTYYTGPNVGEQNDCQCSTVTYCTMSACGTCQSHGIVGWDGWSYNCTSLSVGFFLPGIPDGTVVPAWAFQNMAEVGYIFNITLAQSVGDNPESTGTHVQSTSSLAATSTLASASLTSSASLTNSASASLAGGTSSSSSSNTAVIAGAVGGVVGLALIAAIVIFLRKKRSQTLPSVPPAPDPPPGYTDSIPFFSQTERPKLYDPSDPSTFPSSVHPMTIVTESSNNVYDRTTNRSNPIHLGGHYTGMPEI